MKTLWRGSSILMLAAGVCLFLFAGHALADAEAEVDAAAQLEADLANFEQLSGARADRLRGAAQLEIDAGTASGIDRDALGLRGLDLRLEASKKLVEMGQLVGQMQERGVDVQPQAALLAAQMADFWNSLRSDDALMRSARDRLVAERAELTDPEAISALEPEAARQSEIFVVLFGLGVDGLELSDQLGISSSAQREWLTARILTRARLTGSHLALAFQRLADLDARRAAGTDPATLAPLEVATKHRMSTTSESLRSILALMERLELDGSEYAQLLVESTGELSVEAIDRHIVRQILTEWTATARESVTSSGPGFAFGALLFLVIMTLFYGLSKFVRGVVTRTVSARHLGFSELLKRTVISFSSGAVFVLGLLIALSQLGIEIAPMLAGLGIAGFVLGFALQDTLANFAAGLMVLLYRPYDVGDMIDCAGGVFGEVSHMSLVSTTILTIDNKTLIVPNNKIWGDVITNVTAQDIRRVDLEFGIGYGDDIPKAEKIMAEVLEEHPKVLSDPEPAVKLHSLGDSSVNFVVRPWVLTADYWDTHWDVIREVKLRFDREGVSIPFPQRDVHFYPAEVAEASSGSSDDAANAETVIGSTAITAQDEPDSDEA